MSESRTIFRHTLIYSLAAVLNRGAGFFLVPVFTAYLSADQYGLLGVILITSEIVGAVVAVKLAAAMSRIYFEGDTQEHRHAVVSSALIGLFALILITLALFSLLAKPLAALILQDGALGSWLVLGIAGLLFNVLYTLGLQYHVTEKNSARVFLLASLRSLVYLGVSVFLVAYLQWGVLGALWGLLITNILLSTTVAGPLLFKLGFRFERRHFLAMLRFGLPLLPGQMAEILVKFADRYMLAALASLATSGVFFLALRLAALLQMGLIGPFNQIFIVRRFEAFHEEGDDTQASLVFARFFAIVCAGGLGLALYAPEIVYLFSSGKAEYAGAARVLPLLTLTYLFVSLLSITELGIYYAKKTGYVSLAMLGMLLVHIPLNFWLIPLWGAVGAAAAACLSSLVRLGLTVFLARGLPGPRIPWKAISGLSTSAAGLWWIGTWLDQGAWGFALRLVPLGAFLLGVALSPVFGFEQIKALERAIRRRSSTGRPKSQGVER